jgi:hypothetical protein
MSKTKEQELKNCPFCGDGIGRIVHYTVTVTRTSSKPQWRVRCGNLKCYVEMPGYDTESEARAAWNRRPAHAASEARSGQPGEWTKEIPTEEGYYWQWQDGAVRPEMIELDRCVPRADISWRYLFVGQCLKWRGMDDLLRRAQYYKITVPALPEEGGIND